VSFSVYDITVPVMVHGLNVMDDYLDHAQTLERTEAFEPGRVSAGWQPCSGSAYPATDG
jgi:hypothetical protein